MIYPQLIHLVQKKKTLKPYVKYQTWQHTRKRKEETPDIKINSKLIYILSTYSVRTAQLTLLRVCGHQIVIHEKKNRCSFWYSFW